MSNIAVIGGSGYIGSYLCRNLPAFSDPDPENISKFKIVIYVAGISRRAECNLWEQTYIKNVQDILDFIKILDPDRQLLIYASTGAICTDGPLDNYSKSLLHREDEIKKLKIKSVGLRLAGVVGWAPNMRMDLVHHAMMQAALKSSPIKVHNPNSERGVLWIKDLLEAIKCIIKESDFLQQHTVYSLCSFNTTVIDIARGISKATGTPYEIETGNHVPGFKLDNTEFSRAFGFIFKGTPEVVIQDLLNNAAAVII